MTIKKIMKFTTIIFILLTIKSTAYGKYVFEYTVKVAEIEIIQPQFKAEIIEVKNTNKEYEKYANKQNEIQIKVKVEGKNGIINNFQGFEILVGKEQSQSIKEVEVLENEKNYIIYNVIINDIAGNGPLILKLADNSFRDMVGNKMSEIELDVGIEIDNISPEIESEQRLLENEKTESKTNINIDCDNTID
jgi:hypothetical protein